MKNIIDRIADFIAWRLPRRVLYFSVIRAWAIATTGEYSDREATSVKVIEIVEIIKRK